MRVLLVDDEITIAVTLRDALEEAGHTVFSAGDTAGALAQLEREHPDAAPHDVTSRCSGSQRSVRRSMRTSAVLTAMPSTPVTTTKAYRSV